MDAPRRLVPIEENEGIADLMREVDVMRGLNSEYILRQYCTYIRDNLLWVRERRAWLGECDATRSHTKATPAGTQGRRQIVLDYCPGGSVADYMRVCKRTFEEPYVAAIARCGVCRRSPTFHLRAR